MYQLIKPFLDTKMCVFEEYGTIKRKNIENKM